jgi:cobalt-zinc-cadmium efflux system protein
LPLTLPKSQHYEATLVHGHAHHHAHHHAHDRGHTAGADDRRRLAVALALILGLMAAEVAGGLVASSLALLSDAGHMLTDAAALGLALVAASLARRPPGGAMTYGLRRVEALSAMANGVTLAVLAVLFAVEAGLRLADPAEVRGGLVLGVALAGIAVNGLAARVLAGGGTRTLNEEGAFQHIVTDLYAFLATAVAAALVLAFGWNRADPVAALVVAALMARSAYGLLRVAGRVVLEGAPAGVEPAAVGRALAGAPLVVEVHDLHVWELGTGFPSLSAHVLVRVDCDCHAVRRDLELLLRDRFGIDHTTLQVDHVAPARLLTID